jgi:hypothetical protein
MKKLPTTSDLGIPACVVPFDDNFIDDKLPAFLKFNQRSHIHIKKLLNHNRFTDFVQQKNLLFPHTCTTHTCISFNMKFQIIFQMPFEGPGT